MTEQILTLQNHFLIAMPGMLDFHFHQAVVYVCAHSEEGAMGIIINRPILDISLKEVMEQMDIKIEYEKIGGLPVYLGGPVQPERGFIIHMPNQSWQSTVTTSDEVGVTSSRDILEALAKGEGPAEYLVVLGFSGWGAGQLEQEIAENCWLTVQAQPNIIFNTHHALRWQTALSMLGIDSSNLSSQVGHA